LRYSAAAKVPQAVVSSQNKSGFELEFHSEFLQNLSFAIGSSYYFFEESEKIFANGKDS